MTQRGAKSKTDRLSPDNRSGNSYSVGVAVDSAIGDYASVINQSSRVKVDPAKLAELLSVLRQRHDPQSQENARRIEELLAQLQIQVMDVQIAQQQLLNHFAQQEQHLLEAITTRLATQQLQITTMLVDFVEKGSLAAHEMDRYFASIHAALQEVVQKAKAIEDRQLVEESEKLLAIADDPRSDARHRLKVTLPIVPVLLSYEGEIELSSGLNLQKTWDALKKRITG